MGTTRNPMLNFLVSACLALCRPLNSIASLLACALLLGGLGALLTSTPLLADSKKDQRKDYALIIGTVFDSGGHLAAGVPVKIRRADQKKAKWELISNSMGEFAQRLPVGEADYVVWADIKGRKGDPTPEAKVHIESNERVDISLHLK